MHEGFLQQDEERMMCNMSLLGGGANKGKAGKFGKGFQGAAAGASSVKKKESVGTGLININKLKDMQSRKNSRLDNYKLNPNGLSRFRLVRPIGNDDVPMTSADSHFIPYTKEDGTVGKRMVYCYQQFGFSDCPICALHERMSQAQDQAVVADSDTLRVSNKWAAYIVNRDYMAGSEDPNEDYDSKQDKVVLFNGIPMKIADDIIKHLSMKVWGDASHPSKGYDFECTGSQSSGKMFNGHKVAEYTLSPIPKDFSPSYDEALLRGVKPLTEVVKYMPAAEFNKLFEPIMTSIMQDTEEGAEIIEEFSDYYRALLQEIEVGATEDAREDEETYQSERDVNPDVDDLPTAESEEEAEEDAERNPVQVRKNRNHSRKASDSEAGEENDGSGEDTEEAGQPEKEAGGLEEAAEDPGMEEEEEEEKANAAPQKPKTPATAKPLAPKTAPKVGGSSLLGKLKTIGKK